LLDLRVASWSTFAVTRDLDCKHTKEIVMKLPRLIGASSILFAALHAGVSTADPNAGHAVFVMTNDATKNEIIALQRDSSGALIDSRHYETRGRGSGGIVDPLASQGSLTLSSDGNWLFAANAGSGTISAFAVDGAQLYFVDKIASGGAEPNSIAQHGHLVYVLNTAGASSVVGYFFERGHFFKIPDSLRYLSGTAVGSGSVAFSADGRWLAVTEKATPSIDVFKVQPDGSLSQATINRTVGPGTFSAVFAPDGTLLAAETGIAGATDGAAVSSYQVQSDGTLKVVSASVPTLAAATCWDVIVDGKYLYTSNAGTSSISGFTLGTGGSLTALPGTVVADNPAGSTNIDVAVSADGKHVYTLNTAKGTVGEFAVDLKTGQLSFVGVQGTLPAAAGANGIAAN
jgi:6-phosphogluconolactonase (cycloisomerase 2 family)